MMFKQYLCVAICLLSSLSFSQETATSSDNPLMLIDTSMGEIVVELLPEEAPMAAENFIGLAEGTKPFIDPETGQQTTRPFYDGLIFHRVIDDFMIQSGSPTGEGTGGPGYSFRDEINGRSLGLDQVPAMDEDGYPHQFFGIRDQQGFQDMILGPLYESMGINGQEELNQRADEIYERLQTLTVMDVFQMQGYEYTDDVISRRPVTGVLAMANAGPNTNGSQFFITLADTPWLTGRFTIFGRVQDGMDVVQAIGDVDTDVTDRPLTPVRINSIRRLEN